MVDQSCDDNMKDDKSGGEDEEERLLVEIRVSKAGIEYLEFCILLG